MRSVAPFFLLAATLFGQGSADLFQQAPPAIDKALRDRITQFYQLQVDGKYRQAEALVAEDTKDFYYMANKPKYLGFTIKSITYSDDFTKAKALVETKMVVMVPGFADRPVPVPTPSRWKVVNGEWYWYIDENDLNQTPFGRVKPGPELKENASAAPVMPSQEEIARMLSAVKPDKTQLELKPDVANSGQFVIANSLPGKVKLALQVPKAPGFSAHLDTTELQPNSKATVTVEWKPGEYRVPRFVVVTVGVQPFNQAIPLRVTFPRP